MDFISRVAAKCFSIVLLLMQYVVPSNSYARWQSPTYVKYAQEVRNTYIKQMEKEGFECTQEGGGMPYDVRELDVGFALCAKGSIESGREKIIYLTEKFLEVINAHEGIRPYLREYPFPQSRVNIGLRFRTPDAWCYTDGSVSKVFHARGKIFYHGQNGKESLDLLEEFYEEGFAKVRNNVAIPASLSCEKIVYKKENEKKITPSCTRLKKLVTNLEGFTPGRELEALGIENPEVPKKLPEDLGELIGDVCALYFGEEFLEALAQEIGKKPEGEYVEYWENGQIRARIPYKNGYGEGHVHAWYPDGESAFKAYYKDKKRVGIQFSRYPREICRGQDPFRKIFEYDMEGKLHGTQKTFSRLRSLLSHAEYSHGILHGSSSFYSDKKKTVCFGDWEYKKGKLVKTKVPPVKKQGL